VFSAATRLRLSNPRGPHAFVSCRFAGATFGICLLKLPISSVLMITTLRIIAGLTGFLAAMIQFALLLQVVIWDLQTLFMASEGMTALQHKLLWLLPIGTLIGALLAVGLPATGGAIMLATAAGYFLQLPFGRPGLLSAIPGTIGVIAGLLLWRKRRSRQQT
jgi:hypothetical protein